MSKPTHTPGPWRAQIEPRSYRPVNDLFRAAIMAGNPDDCRQWVDVAHVPEGSESNNPRTDADARLIAAAPALLAASEAVALALESPDETTDLGALAAQLREAVGAAKGANDEPMQGHLREAPRRRPHAPLPPPRDRETRPPRAGEPPRHPAERVGGLRVGARYTHGGDAGEDRR